MAYRKQVIWHQVHIHTCNFNLSVGITSSRGHALTASCHALMFQAMDDLHFRADHYLLRAYSVVKHLQIIRQWLSTV
jgi:hypothetical protein